MGEYVRDVLTDRGALLEVLNDGVVTGEAGWTAGLNVDGFLRWVSSDLGRCSSVVVEATVFDNYGSGYASYVEVLLTKRDGSAHRRTPDGAVESDCLSVLLCRLAPVACLLSRGRRTRGPGGAGAWPMPHARRAVLPPVAGWEQQSLQIQAALGRHGLSLADPEVLGRSLPHGLVVESALTSAYPTIFDVWFHWSD